MAFKVQDIFSIPYSGNIERIDAGKVPAYSVPEEGNVAKIYEIQQERIASAGLNVTVIAPGHAGGLIVRCEAREAQSVYDVVFGGSAPALKAKAGAEIIEFPKQGIVAQASMLRQEFGNAADRFHMTKEFCAAASMPVAANLTHAPALRAEAA